MLSWIDPEEAGRKLGRQERRGIGNTSGQTQVRIHFAGQALWSVESAAPGTPAAVSPLLDAASRRMNRETQTLDPTRRTTRRPHRRVRTLCEVGPARYYQTASMLEAYVTTAASGDRRDLHHLG